MQICCPGWHVPVPRKLPATRSRAAQRRAGTAGAEAQTCHGQQTGADETENLHLCHHQAELRQQQECQRMAALASQHRSSRDGGPLRTQIGLQGRSLWDQWRSLTGLHGTASCTKQSSARGSVSKAARDCGRVRKQTSTGWWTAFKALWTVPRRRTMRVRSTSTPRCPSWLPGSHSHYGIATAWQDNTRLLLMLLSCMTCRACTFIFWLTIPG